MQHMGNKNMYHLLDQIYPGVCNPTSCPHQSGEMPLSEMDLPNVVFLPFSEKLMGNFNHDGLYCAWYKCLRTKTITLEAVFQSAGGLHIFSHDTGNLPYTHSIEKIAQQCNVELLDLRAQDV